MLPSLVGNFVGQRLYIVGTAPRVHVLADVGFFLNIDLRITGDTGREVGRQGDGFVEGVGVQRLRMTQCGSHGLDTGTADVVERILFGQRPAGSLRVCTQCQ